MFNQCEIQQEWWSHFPSGIICSSWFTVLLLWHFILKDVCVVVNSSKSGADCFFLAITKCSVCIIGVSYCYTEMVGKLSFVCILFPKVF